MKKIPINLHSFLSIHLDFFILNSIKILILLSAHFMLIAEKSFAQPDKIKFEHITVNDGLSQNTVNCIFQDSRGFMWFGTHDGLNRYDGYEVIQFNHDPLDSNSLANNIIH